MSTVELKTDLHNLINEINDNTVLKAIYMLLKKQTQNGTVGYTSAMSPLTKKAFIKRIEKAEAQVKKGQYVTIEQLEKESENW